MVEFQASGDRRNRTAAPSDLMDIARLAYIYGLPAYEVARLRYRALSLPRRGQSLQMNTFWHTRALSTPATADVTAVNSDTILSRAWIDLSQSALIVQVPVAAGRYYSMALMDAFSNNFAVLGPFNESLAGNYVLLVGPDWDGAAPAHMTVIRAPTNSVWALVRIIVDGPGDLTAVHALQDQLMLAKWGAPNQATPLFDPLSVPVMPLDGTKPLAFLDILNSILTQDPPPASDRPVLDRLADIDVGPGLRFDRRAFSEPQLEAMRQGLASGREALRAEVGFRTQGRRPGAPERWPSDLLLASMAGQADQVKYNRRIGWSGPRSKAGNFGTDYRLRAQCALAGLGLLPREEAMYFTTATDVEGSVLDGRAAYALRFSPQHLPPVDAFWSLTAYQTDEDNRRWLAQNAIDRYSIGSRKPDLDYGSDGSLEIVFQHDAPKTENENWLPIPKAKFMLTLRAYRPRQPLLDGSYRIPELQRRGPV